MVSKYTRRSFAGWIASKIMGNDAQMGWIANIVVGIIGGAIGKFVLGLINVEVGKGWLASAGVAILGAVILLAIINTITGRR